jgi:site-specific DNA recombinase
MANTAILYARVSTREQADHGYSLRQQIEALRKNHADCNGFEVIATIEDPGFSGASLNRPGLGQVRKLVADGGVTVVLALERDRISREPAYYYLLKKEFEQHGTALKALNDAGDISPAGELTDGIMDQIAKFQRATFADKSRKNKLRKAREGKVSGSGSPPYGFEYNADRTRYEVDEAAMTIVRRMFKLVAEDGLTLHSVKKTFEREGITDHSTNI